MAKNQTPDDVFKDRPLEELEKMQKDLEGVIEAGRKRMQQKAINQICDIVQEHDLSYEAVVKAIRTVAKRGKAIPLYRNPDNWRQTWSGKGEAPDWYTSHPNPEDLKIPDAS